MIGPKQTKTNKVKRKTRDKVLNGKQQRFIVEYMKDGSGTEAARRAGYSKATAYIQGSRLLKNDMIASKIEELTQERLEKLKVSPDWVIDRLKTISDRCMQEIPVYDKEGNPTGEYKFDAAGANKSTELLGKHLGVFQEQAPTNDIKSDIDRAILALLTTKQPTQQPKPDDTDETRPIISN